MKYYNEKHRFVLPIRSPQAVLAGRSCWCLWASSPWLAPV